MINRQLLTKEQVLYAIDKGEFNSDVLASKQKVVVIMTQDWCPQWSNMRSWVYGLQTQEDIDIYELIYNKVDFSKRFIEFKENKWNNDEIPYLRYYKDGKLYKESNYVGKQGFQSILEI